ncbi:hypothetical protein ENBRE01_3043, partial [Enteropsectra breve]
PAPIQPGAAPAPPVSLFGAQNSSFGGAQPFGSTQSQGFGSAPAQGFGATASQGFGNTAPFGSTQNQGFGKFNPTGFNAANTSMGYTAPSPGLFGSSMQNTPMQSSSMQNTPMQNPMGNTSNTQLSLPSATTMGGFMNKTPTMGLSTDSFAKPSYTPNMFQSTPSYGTQTPTTSFFSNPLLNKTGFPTSGSKNPIYMPTKVKEDYGGYIDLNHICGMKEYQDKCNDEIRKEDYELSRKPGQSSSSYFGGSMGNNMNSGFSTGLNSNLNNNMPGSLGSMNNINNMNSNMNNSLNSMGNTVGNTMSSGMNSNMGTPATSLFNNPNTTLNVQQPLSLPQAGTSLFNKPAAGLSFSSQPATSAFGSTAGLNQPTPFNLNNTVPSANTSTPAGNAPAVSLFGATQQAPVSLFGNSTMQPVSLFGGSNPQSNSFLNPNMNNNQIGNVSNPSYLNNQNYMSNQNYMNNQNYMSNNGAYVYNNGNPQYCDPYLAGELVYEKIEKQKPGLKGILPEPIFSAKNTGMKVELKIRPKNSISNNSFNRENAVHSSESSGMYTVPEITGNERRVIESLVVGKEGVGKIEYLEPVTVKNAEELRKGISFGSGVIEVSDAAGTGLNKRARVTLENVFPIAKNIKGKSSAAEEKGLMERFVYQLKNDDNKKFIDYDGEAGRYVYEVNHF